MLEYVAGETAMPFTEGTDVDPDALSEIGRIIRDLHDTLESFVPPTDAHWQCPIPSNGADLVIHNDLAPWNLIRSSERLVFIDWDGVAPGTRLWDLSYAAHAFVPLQPTTDVDDAGRDLRALVDGYDLEAEARIALIDLLVPRTMSMYDLLARGHETGTEPWATLWNEGHGDVWREDAEWIGAHRERLSHWLDPSSG
jgi:Ser/Thr protein kinase RdoA (MazF antagonist)